MAQLAIKGHPTRGKEVIQLLELLGGKNIYKLDGKKDLWYILSNLTIEHATYCFDERSFILEEFEKKFPYKVGDKVIYEDKKREITKMVWEEQTNTIAYKLDDKLYCNVINDLQPYEEENMEEREIIEPITEINLNHPCFDGHNEIELIIPAGWEFEQRGNKMFGVRKQPKDYVECCECLKHNPFINNVSGYKRDTIEALQTLITCRDAYWKLAGENMGLDKPWEPDWASGKPFYCISVNGNIINKSKWYTDNKILAFPTPEMRDAFYENFRELIEQCKELL